MTLFCRADISIALPRPLLWDLITDPAARQLWQPDVQSATIEAGYGGGKGSVITLEAGRNKRSVSVTERVIRVRQQESLVVLQSWPKHELQKKYIVLAESANTTLLTLQMRHREQKSFRLFSKQMTNTQLEAHACEELLGMKNLSAQLHTRIAEQSEVAEAR